MNEALLREAYRALFAVQTLGVVYARVRQRDLSTARLVAVAIAVHRQLFARDDGSDDLKAAFCTIWGKDYKNKRRLAPWLTRVSQLDTTLRNLSSDGVSNLLLLLGQEAQAVGIARRTVAAGQRSKGANARRANPESPRSQSAGRTRISACRWRRMAGATATLEMLATPT